MLTYIVITMSISTTVFHCFIYSILRCELNPCCASASTHTYSVSPLTSACRSTLPANIYALYYTTCVGITYTLRLQIIGWYTQDEMFHIIVHMKCRWGPDPKVVKHRPQHNIDLIQCNTWLGYNIRQCDVC